MPAPLCLALRHVHFEDLGAWALPVAEAGYRLRYHDLGIEPLDGLDPLAPALLVALGGPVGAYEGDLYPFLEQERELLRARLEAGRPTLGICLGAQLMAAALGAEVKPGPAKEIGWAALDLTEAGRASPLRHVAGVPVLHWHGDGFALPPGADRLAATPPCANQAFALGRTILGLQFHAEATPSGFERWLIGHALEIATTKGVSVPQLRADMARFGPALEAPARACLAEWLAGLDA